MPDMLNQFHSAEFWRGPTFPIGLTGSLVVVVEDLDEVFSSILQILNTRKGERIMYPNFGSNLGPLLWEPHDLFLQEQVRVELMRSLAIWEPRLRVISVDFEDSPMYKNLGILVISIQMRLINNPRLDHVVKVPVSSQGTLFRSS